MSRCWVDKRAGSHNRASIGSEEPGWRRSEDFWRGRTYTTTWQLQPDNIPQPDNRSRATCIEKKRKKATKSAELSRTLLTRTICQSEWSHPMISI